MKKKNRITIQRIEKAFDEYNHLEKNGDYVMHFNLDDLYMVKKLAFEQAREREIILGIFNGRPDWRSVDDHKITIALHAGYILGRKAVNNEKKL